ncbi:hypothetical protein [Shinella pollutisoli]|uniref:Uncharacterized protein n=1 Tax=Shinella pollutisoli TaxID=2250594 RepID=A0ABV7D9L1_9HYPH|nr:hypothetical protein [Shinella pollutisoli]
MAMTDIPYPLCRPEEYDPLDLRKRPSAIDLFKVGDAPMMGQFVEAAKKTRDSIVPADLIDQLSRTSGSDMGAWLDRNRESITLALNVLDCWKSYMDGGFLNDDEFVGETLAHFAEAGGWYVDPETGEGVII